MSPVFTICDEISVKSRQKLVKDIDMDLFGHSLAERDFCTVMCYEFLKDWESNQISPKAHTVCDIHGKFEQTRASIKDIRYRICGYCDCYSGTDQVLQGFICNSNLY